MTTPEPPEIVIDLTAAEPAQEPKRRRLGVIVASAALALVLVAGAGAYAGYQFLFGGVQPSERLPASLLAYVSVDLKPGLDQQRKLQNLVRKFPKAVSNGDSAQEVVDNLLKKLDVDDIDAEKDLASWVGPRASAGLWLHQDKPFFVAAVATTDDQNAVEALTRIVGKVKGASTGFIVENGVALIAIGDKGGLDAAKAAVQEAKDHPFTESAAFADARKWLGDDHTGALWLDLNRAEELAKTSTDGKEMLKALGDKPKGTFAMGIRATGDGIEARYRTFGSEFTPAGTADAMAKLGAQPAGSTVAAVLTLPDLSKNEALKKLLDSPAPKGNLTAAEEAELMQLMVADPEDLTDAQTKRGLELIERMNGRGPANPMASMGKYLLALSGATLAGSLSGELTDPAFQITAHVANAGDAKMLGELSDLVGGKSGPAKVTTNGNEVTLSAGKLAAGSGKLSDNAAFKTVTAGAPGQVQLAVFVDVKSMLTVKQQTDFGPVKAAGVISGYDGKEIAGSIRLLID